MDNLDRLAQKIQSLMDAHDELIERYKILEAKYQHLLDEHARLLQEKSEEGPTEKQLKYIHEMYEFSDFPIPEFTGKTKKEASDYIDRYKKLAHQSSWAIEHGYD